MSFNTKTPSQINLFIIFRAYLLVYQVSKNKIKEGRFRFTKQNLFPTVCRLSTLCSMAAWFSGSLPFQNFQAWTLTCCLYRSPTLRTPNLAKRGSAWQIPRFPAMSPTRGAIQQSQGLRVLGYSCPRVLCTRVHQSQDPLVLFRVHQYWGPLVLVYLGLNVLRFFCTRVYLSLRQNQKGKASCPRVYLSQGLIVLGSTGPSLLVIILTLSLTVTQT